MNICDHFVHLLLSAVFNIMPFFLIFLLVRKSVRQLSKALFLTLTTYFYLQTSIALLLGAIGALNLTGLLVADGTVLLLFWFSIYRHSGAFHGKELKADSSSRLSDTPFTFLLITILGVGIALLFKISSNAFIGHDCLAYHLPVMAEWYNSSAITPLHYWEYLNATFYFFSWETTAILFVIPYQCDFLAAYPNILAWILFGLSVYLVSLDLGATNIHALAASALTLVIPVVIDSINKMQVDLALATFFMSGLYLLLLLRRSFSFNIFVLFLMNTGMITSLKVSGFAYSALLMFLLLFVFINSFIVRKLRTDPHEKPGGSSVWLGVLGIPAAALLGGFWFIKNMHDCAILFSDPFKFIKPGESYIVRIKNTTIAHLFDPLDIEHWNILFDKIDHMLSIPFALLLLFTALFPLLSVIRRKKNINVAGQIIVCFLLIATFFLYIFSPYSADNPVSGGEFVGLLLAPNTRFAFSMMGVMGVLSALSMTLINLRKEIVSALAIISCMFVGFFMVKTALVITPILYLAYLLKNLGKRFFNVKRGTMVTSSILILTTVILTSYFLRMVKINSRTIEYGTVFDFVTDNIDSTDKLGYVLSSRSYIFRGRNLNQDTEYVRSTSDDQDQWIDMLRRKGVTMVAVGPVKGDWKNQRRWNFMRELEWLQDEAGPFKKIFGSNVYEEAVIFRLIE